MQEEQAAFGWTKFLGKLVAFLGAIFLILVVLSWLRCGGRAFGSLDGHSHPGHRLPVPSASVQKN